METKMYKLFSIDTCFEDYAANYDYVGAESIEDLIAHFDDIYPGYEQTVIREDWMNDYDWDEETENGKYKEGDIKIIPYFEGNQKQQIIDSVNDNMISRIIEKPHMFTDTPYEVIDGFGYCE